MLDVIEHVEDDRGFVDATVGDLLSEGGIVLVSVPAYDALFSSHDRALRHTDDIRRGSAEPPRAVGARRPG